MNKDLHDIDDIFNEAGQRYEDEPSAAVWDKINADLDRKDAEKYKRRFIGWKRIAIILLFLLSGFVLYESGIVINRSGSGSSNETATGNPGSKDSVQHNTAGNILKRRHNTDTDNQTGIPVIKETVNEKYSTEKELRQQDNTSGIDEKNQTVTINTYAPFENKNIVTAGSINKRKISGNEQVPVSRNQQKIVKEQESKDLVTAQKQKQDLLTAEPDNSPVNTIEETEIPLIKNYILTTEKVPAYKLISQSMIANKKSSLNISDSVLSKSLITANSANKKNKFKPYWSITGVVSNDWAQYKLENDKEDNNGQPRQDESSAIAKRERHEPSFSSGIMATRQFSKHLSLKTGLIYSNTAIAINPQEIYATQKTDGSIAYKYNTSSGYGYIKPGFGSPPAIGDSLRSAEAQHSLQTLSVPLLLGYRIEKKKYTVTPSAGITANIVTRAKIQTEVKDALNRETVTINGLNGLNHFYAAFMADLNMQYNLDKSWAVNLLPTFKYALSPITKSNVVKTFPYSFGIATGVTYKF